MAARLFNDFPVDVYFLEYDSQRAGDFSPLRHVPKDRHVVLGLVSSKTPTLERPDDLRRRIDEAARFVDLERLSLSRNAASPASPAATRSTRTRNGPSSA